MKINKILAAFMLCAAVFTACNTKNPPVVGPGGDDDKKDTTVVVPDTTAPDTIGWNIPAEVLTVAQARDIASNLESGATSNAKYYIMGWVKKLHSKHADGITNYGNAQFYIEDVKGANSSDDFLAYQVYGPNGEKLTSADQVVVGDFVVLYGEITNYNGTYETVGKGAAYIWKSTNALINGGGSDQGADTDPVEVTGDGTRTNPYTATDIISLNNTKTGNYWVKAYIVGQVPGKAISAAEFAAPFTPSTDTTTFGTNIIIAASVTETDYTKCVPVQLPAGVIRNALNLPENPDNLGKEVLLYGSLEKYFGQAGAKSISYAEFEGNKIGVDPDVEQVEPTATKATVAEFIAAEESTSVYYELTGTIGGTINTTYGNFDLTDETGTVYVYGLTKAFIAVGSTKNDKSYSSLGLVAGDNITIRGYRGSYNGKVEVCGAYFVKKN